MDGSVSEWMYVVVAVLLGLAVLRIVTRWMIRAVVLVVLATVLGGYWFLWPLVAGSSGG